MPPLQAVMAVITGVSRRKAHSSLAAVRSSSHTDAADASPRRRCPGGGKWPPFMTPRRKNQYFRPNLFVPQQLTPKAYQIHGKPVPGTPWWREIRIAQYFPNGGSSKVDSVAFLTYNLLTTQGEEEGTFGEEHALQRTELNCVNCALIRSHPPRSTRLCSGRV